VPEKAWGTEKAKAMLAYLLWKGPNGASREEMSVALWSGRSGDETANVYHVTLHRLRRVLEPMRKRGSSYVLHQGGRYRFNFHAPHFLDVTAFRDLVSNGSLKALREAIDLYRGVYMEDVDWALPPEAEWERRVMERLYMDALRQLAARADGREEILFLEKLLAFEPADEAAQQALVASYLARGRRDLARHQVLRWREALAELDLEPSVETKAIWSKVEYGNSHILIGDR
jgi:DNA-binding SARP family transcriptional activator